MANYKEELLDGLIQKGEIHEHSKASEFYIEATFHYPEFEERLEVWVPIEYRRTGVFAYSEGDESEVNEILRNTYKYHHPDRKTEWLENQKEFWEPKNANVTQSFFEALKSGGWKCVNCDLPENPNYARRIQDLKEYGYTISTNTNKWCEECNSNTTHLMMLRVPKGGGELGYETISKKLKKRILSTLNFYDAFEAKKRKTTTLIPDHKFPEIRWGDDTKEKNSDDMSEEEINDKFQLLNNRRNLQKREVCRDCYQTGQRGYPYGIKFYYEGDEHWPEDVPKRGSEAEKGCIGCGWYDIEAWRKNLNKHLEKM